MLSSLWLLIAIPAASAAVLLLCGRRAKTWGPCLGVLAPAASFVLGLSAFIQLAGRSDKLVEQNLWSFIPVGSLKIDFGLMFDPLTGVFVLLITVVGSLIHLYAVGYMAHDERRVTFFGYFNLFIAAMLTLVLG